MAGIQVKQEGSELGSLKNFLGDRCYVTCRGHLRKL